MNDTSLLKKVGSVLNSWLNSPENWSFWMKTAGPINDEESKMVLKAIKNKMTQPTITDGTCAETNSKAVSSRKMISVSKQTKGNDKKPATSMIMRKKLKCSKENKKISHEKVMYNSI